MKLFNALHSLDLWTFDWCLKRKHRQLFVNLSRWVSRSADGYLYAIAALLFALSNQWLLVKILFIGFSVERILYFMLKNKLRRNRPQQAIPGYQSVIQPSDQFSFPSGHTSAAFLMMGIISAFYPILGIPLLIWAIWVGISRVMLGVHFPTDSVAGAILGYTISQYCLTLFL
ncbi:MAG: phosphatase PAP2 family protein [Cellvibrionaceae bacterium]